MLNTELVTNFLQTSGQYPQVLHVENTGLHISVENNRLFLCGCPSDLIDLADLLVSLALSGSNRGQHWHIDNMTLVSECSSIAEIILQRDD